MVRDAEERGINASFRVVLLPSLAEPIIRTFHTGSSRRRLRSLPPERACFENTSACDLHSAEVILSNGGSIGHENTPAPEVRFRF